MEGPPDESPPLSRRLRLLVLAVAFGGLVFDGIELGLMPVASLSVSRSLMGAEFTDTAAGDWFARYTAALMLGAAVGRHFRNERGGVTEEEIARAAANMDVDFDEEDLQQTHAEMKLQEIERRQRMPM